VYAAAVTALAKSVRLPRKNAMRIWVVVAAVLGLALIVACGSGGDADAVPSTSVGEPSATTEPPSESATQPATASGEGVQACADVIGGDIERSGDGTFRISATVRSGETGWEKYADAWEVRKLDGTVIDVRVLAHPHVTEQPFTRSLSSVTIPEDTGQVILAARDLVNGFCGETLTLDVPR
jgi:hypothetical protein